MSNPFGRIMSAMVTPFDASGAVDHDTAQALAKHLVAEGNDGLVITGTTGEAPTLSDDEKVELYRAVVEAVDAPVIAGTVGNDTAHSIGLSRRAADVGVHGILTLCPYYNRPSQAGIAAHLRAVAEAVDLPQIIYNIPIRTGRLVENATLLQLAAEVPNLIGVKDATGNPAATAALAAAAPDFIVYSGDDAMTLPLLAVGAVGVIGVATHWTAPEHVEMLDAFDRGDIAAARSANARMLESFKFETGDDYPNPIPTKAMMRHLGIPVGQCRLPMGPGDDTLDARAAAVWKNLEATRA